jgi:hypothetical protein
MLIRTTNELNSVSLHPVADEHTPVVMFERISLVPDIRFTPFSPLSPESASVSTVAFVASTSWHLIVTRLIKSNVNCNVNIFSDIFSDIFSYI